MKLSFKLDLILKLKFELKSNFSTCPDVGGWAVGLNDNNAILNKDDVVVEVGVELGKKNSPKSARKK